MVRALVLEQLDEWGRVRRRMDRAEADAIHDFRVALRRLRSTLRAFRPELSGRVRRRTRRGLRRLADVSGASRDIQVQREWLQARIPTLTRTQKHGARWLLNRLDHEQGEADLRLSHQVKRRFTQVYADLDRAFTPLGTTHPLNGAEAAVTAPRLVAKLAEHGADLTRRLTLVHDVECAAEAHAARISAKRLRYLVEPFAPELPEGGQIVDRLKGLQALLGDLHDRHRTALLLRDALEDTARARADLLARGLLPGLAHEAPADRGAARAQPGLLALAALVRTECDDLFARLHDEWLDGKGEQFLAGIPRLVPFREKPGLRLLDEEPAPPTSAAHP